MSFRAMVMGLILGLVSAPLLADEVIYRYEGDVVPYDESEGWFINDP